MVPQTADNNKSKQEKSITGLPRPFHKIFNTCVAKYMCKYS